MFVFMMQKFTSLGLPYPLLNPAAYFIEQSLFTVATFFFSLNRNLNLFEFFLNGSLPNLDINLKNFITRQNII